MIEWFLKDHVTPKTGVIMLKIQLYVTGINSILKYIQIYIYFLICNNISQYCTFDQISAAWEIITPPHSQFCLYIFVYKYIIHVCLSILSVAYFVWSLWLYCRDLCCDASQHIWIFDIWSKRSFFVCKGCKTAGYEPNNSSLTSRLLLTKHPAAILNGTFRDENKQAAFKDSLMQ